MKRGQFECLKRSYNNLDLSLDRSEWATVGRYTEYTASKQHSFYPSVQLVNSKLNVSNMYAC